MKANSQFVKWFFLAPCLVLLVLVLTSCKNEQTPREFKEVILSENWEFKALEDSTWLPAKVPGTVHTDLLKNKLIEDPFYRLNEHALQWIDKKDWEYSTTFEVTSNELEFENIDLQFLGLDTYSEIYLNDELILTSDNMFRTYELAVKGNLKEGENELRVVFSSPIKKGIEKYDALGYQIPVSNNDLAEIGKVEGEKAVSIFTRKAGYHFGWDWGPRLVSSGIWRPVTLKYWDSHQITNLNVVQHEIEEKKASLTAVLEVNVSSEDSEGTVAVIVNGKELITEKVSLVNGTNTLAVPFEINNPKRWWPNGLGEQVLYNVEVRLTSNGLTDAEKQRVGLRKIELVTDADSIGNAFYFKINDVPVFMKGANYIPQDVFLTEVGSERYEHILQSAQDANMNMLRVWGGGVYETDEFYDLCDEKGLLVWQDFMFACAMFPGDKAFLDNVRQEAIDNVKRLRHHASIALWCGNNEILSAWGNWGWKNNVVKDQSAEVADTIWKAYDDVFHKILPEVVTELDNGRSYWPSSPGSAFGEKESFERGDAHYWMVWWGKEPFKKYNDAIPRFMSEYGFQSFPNMSTINKYTVPEDHDIFSEVMKSHQRSTIGNGTIDEYMKRHYKQPKDFESFIYCSQLLQAHGIKVGIEAHRRNRARCMGSLYWQIDDCWPVASWSSIDYYGNWKALHYAVKRGFESQVISFEESESELKCHVINDKLEPVVASLKLELISFEGKEIKTWDKELTIKANSAAVYYELTNDKLPDQKELKSVLLKTTIVSEGVELVQAVHYFHPFKDLELPQPELSFELAEDDDLLTVTVSTKNLAKDVFVTAQQKGNFSDNYFDLLPGESKSISILKSKIKDIEAFKKDLKVLTLWNTFE